MTAEPLTACPHCGRALVETEAPRATAPAARHGKDPEGPHMVAITVVGGMVRAYTVRRGDTDGTWELCAKRTGCPYHVLVSFAAPDWDAACLWAGAHLAHPIRPRLSFRCPVAAAGAEEER